MDGNGKWQETKTVEAILRNGQLFPLKRRNRIFAAGHPRARSDALSEVAGFGCEFWNANVNLEFAGSFEEIPS